MKLTNRIERLEAKAPTTNGIWHRIIQRIGMTQDEAIDAYGREKVGPADNIVIRAIINPKGASNEA